MKRTQKSLIKMKEMKMLKIKEMKIHKKEKEENFLKIRYVHLLVVGWLCVGCAPFTNKYLVEMY